MINIYTDGGFRPKYQLGAYAYIILSGGQLTDSYSKAIKIQPDIKVTSITMEMTAAIEAFKCLLANSDNNNDKYVYLSTDSQYVQLGLTEWYIRWRTNGWRGSNGKVVQNLKLWKELYKLYMQSKKQYSTVIVQWTKAHGTDEFNNHVDKLCNDVMDDYIINIKK